MKSDFCILGCGYVGSFLLKNSPNSYYTNRQNGQNDKAIYFDLNKEETWKNIPQVQNILWTFPAATNHNEITHTVKFFRENLKNRNVIIFSSTSAYIRKFENEIINENSELCLSEPRFLAEEQLRNEGALILHLSGIIGPERTPLLWYKKNRVKYGENTLNYIHVEDIVYFIEKLFDFFAPSERFNLTSQDYKNHNQILNILIQRNLMPENYQFKDSLNGSKKIENIKILRHLNIVAYKFKKYPEDVEL